MMVLDSEGLRTQGITHSVEHDNELATLIIGLADLTLINVEGENMAEIKDILQIVVHAFLRMDQADSPHRRQCMFIHQNVSATNVQTKLATDRQQLQKELDKMTEEASEVLGLPETITAFSRIINFDCKCDVVYFTHLWHGNPPMATINQEYSTCAAEMRHTILKRSSNCMEMSDFPQQVEDMWKGMLADNFIFSFRNNLAAKAYIEVERKFSEQTLKAEENLSMWVNQSCNIEIQNCSSEDDLDSCLTELNISLSQRIHGLLTQELKSLKQFFDDHKKRDIIIQWQAEKEASLKLFFQTEERHMHSRVDNLKIRQVFKLRQKSTFHDHEQKIMKQAVSLAENLRGNCPSDEDLKYQFDKIWDPFESNLVSEYSLPASKAVDHLHSILWHVITKLGCDKYLHDQLEETPLVPDASLSTITEQDMSKDHIVLKGTLQQIFQSRTSFMESTASLAKDMMDVVTKRVQELCERDIMFDKLFARHTINLAVKKVSDHNAVPNAKFSFTPQFIAFFVIRVACYATAHFDKMNQRFEERHGVQAKLNDYRPRVFLLFKNTVEEKAAELVLAANFCEAIKGTLLEVIRINLDRRVVREIYHRIGTLKYDLITKMLDQFLQERSFTKLITYVHDPYESARLWMQEFGNDHIFGKTGGKTHYSEFANYYVDEIIAEVRSSTEAASQEILSTLETDQPNTPETNQPSTRETDQPSAQETHQPSIPETDQPSTSETNQPSRPKTNQPSAPETVQANTLETDQHSIWIRTFCECMKSIAPIDPASLEVTKNYRINHFAHYQQALEQSLQELEEDMKKEFLKGTGETVKWADVKDPFQKVCERLWGCIHHCPFCHEPCQHSDPNHKTSHRCIQHRPPGIGGTRHKKTTCLSTDTCSVKITEEQLSFNCHACEKQCRKTTHCNTTDDIEEFHHYLEYKKFLPDWDIAPDPAGEASKFWKWVMCTFQEELLKEYEGTKLEIPDSWKGVTEKEANDSLRKYFQ